MVRCVAGTHAFESIQTISLTLLSRRLLLTQTLLPYMYTAYLYLGLE